MNTMSADNLIKEVLLMSENERARIAEQIIASLHSRPTHEVEKAWQEEIEKRVKQIDSGEIKCIPWEEIKNKLQDQPQTAD